MFIESYESDVDRALDGSDRVKADVERIMERLAGQLEGAQQGDADGRRFAPPLIVKALDGRDGGDFE